MRKIFWKAIFLMPILVTLSCQKESGFSVLDQDLEKVVMLAGNMSYDVLGSDTKTSVTIKDNVAEFSWEATDVVGVFPNNGTQVRFPIVDGSVEGGSSTSQANFTGGGWAVKKANKYMAYYPFIPDMDLQKQKIPVSYLGQTQHGNDNSDHFRQYDFMAAAAESPNQGEISFHFKHLGCLFEFIIVAPKVGEYTTLSLISDGQFVTTGDYDLMANVPAIRHSATSNEIVLNLEDVQTTEPNEVLKFYMMMAPVDLSGNDIKLKLKGPHAEFEVDLGKGTNFTAGRFYRPSLSGIQGGEIIMLEPGADVVRDIKTLANGEPYPADKMDYRINRICFETDNSSVPEGQAGISFCDISATDSPMPIYAIWDSNTGTITIRTSAHYVYGNVDSRSMLYNLRKLKSIDFTGFSSELIRDVSNFFAGCAELCSVDLSQWNLSACESLVSLFGGCVRLEDVVGLTPRNPVLTRYMCSGCSSLRTFDMTGWKLSGMADHMFELCSNLESVNMTDVTSTGFAADAMFYACTSLKSIDISSIDPEAITGVSRMFQQCFNLETITFGEYFGNRHIRDYNHFLADCRKLKQIDLSKFRFYDVVSYAAMFAGCYDLMGIDPSKIKVSSYTTSLNQIFGSCRRLTSADLSTWNTIAVQDMAHMFSGCSALESINVLALNTMNVTRMELMFEGCSALRSIDVSRFDTSNVENMDGMFANCTQLEHADISNFDMSNVTNFSRVFLNCTNLQSVNFSEKNLSSTAKMTDMSYLFSGCKALKYMDLRGFDTHNVSNMTAMFYECESLESVNMSGLNTSRVSSFGSLFRDCEKLQEITGVEDFDTHFSDWFNSVFENCKSLERLDLSKWQTPRNSVCHLMFEGCDKLTYLDISGFSTENMTDGGRMFMGMNSLETLKLGDKFVYSTSGLGPFNGANNVGVNVYCSRAVMESIRNDSSSNGFWRSNNFFDYLTNEQMKVAGSETEL